MFDAIGWIRNIVPRLRTPFLLLVLFGFLVAHIWLGTLRTQNSTYSTGAGVYGEYMNGLVRLIFPVVAAGIGMAMLHSRLAHNFISFTRTRRPLQLEIWGSIRVGVVRNISYFAFFGIATLAASQLLAPVGQPHLVSAKAFGLSKAAAAALQSQQTPIGWAMGGGTYLYGAVATLWMIAGSIVMTIAVSALLVVTSRRGVALVVGLMVYLAESIFCQALGDPEWGFLAIFPIPTNLIHFPVWAAIAPPVLVLGIGLAFIQRSIRRADVAGNFS